MNLSKPIVVQPNPLRKSNGSFKNLLPITLNELKFIILDDISRKECAVRITPFPKPLVLWSGDEYDSVGDYTQAQVDARVLEKLGNKPQDVLKTLMTSHEIVVK